MIDVFMSLPNFADGIVTKMVNMKCIPSTGAIHITEQNMLEFMVLYSKHLSTNGENKLNNSNFRYARKLAGVSLLKENHNRGIAPSDIDAGIVYLIENPAFPGVYKVGMTIDLVSRLNQYQTYDPKRQFAVAHYEFVLNRRRAESWLIQQLKVDFAKGEWVSKKNASDALKLAVKMKM